MQRSNNMENIDTHLEFAEALAELVHEISSVNRQDLDDEQKAIVDRTQGIAIRMSEVMDKRYQSIIPDDIRKQHGDIYAPGKMLNIKKAD